jgi:hypothetical protein
MAICIEELEPDRVRAWVRYHHDQEKARTGRIKFWNPRYVFVVYDCAGQWDRFVDFVAVATSPEDLDFAATPST